MGSWGATPPPPIKHPAMSEVGWGARTPGFYLSSLGKESRSSGTPSTWIMPPPLVCWEQAARTPEFLPLKLEAKILLAWVAVVDGRERLRL